MSYRDKETLHNLYVNEQLDQSEIADRFNVSQGTISKWIKRHNIKRPLEDSEYLEKMYHGQGMSLSEIADEIGCWPGSVGKAMERHGIDRRKSDKEKLPTPRTNNYGHELWTHNKDGTQHNIYVHRLLAVAEYGIEKVKEKDVHHINGVPWDNRPDNIEVLSREKHTIEHLPHRDNNGRFTD